MKIRIKFSKQGNMRFIGHLDIMRYFQKAMRRAAVDIRYSEGFSPHQIMSFAAPLGVGLTGSGEYLDIEVLSTESSGRMVERLNAQMAEGMEVLSFKRLPDSAGNAMSLVAACDYTAVSYTHLDVYKRQAEYFMAHPEIPHGTIKIAFTPDEEVGHGVDFFDVPGWGADVAYTCLLYTSRCV